MNTFFESVKSFFRNRRIYKKLRNNPLLLKINQHYRNKAEETKRQSVHAYGLEALKLAKETFQELKRDFWLDYGTLLGAIRENDFIGHDSDCDIATFFTGNDDAKKVENTMKKRGFQKSREFWRDGKIVEETYIYNGVNLDVYYYYPAKSENHVACYALEEGEHTFYQKLKDYTVVTGLNVKKFTSTFTGIIWIDFKGEQFPVPESYAQYLEDNYGPSYLVKDEQWDWAEKDKGMLPYQDNTKAYLYHI